MLSVNQYQTFMSSIRESLDAAVPAPCARKSSPRLRKPEETPTSCRLLAGTRRAPGRYALQASCTIRFRWTATGRGVARHPRRSMDILVGLKRFIYRYVRLTQRGNRCVSVQTKGGWPHRRATSSGRPNTASRMTSRQTVLARAQLTPVVASRRPTSRARSTRSIPTLTPSISSSRP